ncbi:unnamed protein product [Linum trigynum]|uniref:Reverse transcriptase Ty1/copia-type domain-containing protein n=1 Tax=Linum trigynum TaxID=586398 RepID=A0AAV2DUH3_9ROSI
MTTLTLFLAIAVVRSWNVHQLDVKSAFLHGDITKEVYMKFPKRYAPPLHIPNTVYGLKKSLYGLKQASRQWFSNHTDSLTTQGYVSSQVDHSLFYKTVDTNYTCVLMYVDDLVLGGNDLTKINHLKQLFYSSFSIKDMGPLKFFFGIEIATNSSGIHLSQYTLEILEKVEFLLSKPVTTPMDYKIHLTSQHSDPYPAPNFYKRLLENSYTSPLPDQTLALPLNK